MIINCQYDFPASELDWSKEIKHFRPDQHWGDLDKVSAMLILRLDVFVDLLGFPVYPTPKGYGAAYSPSGHARESWHYVIEGRNKYALAVDVFPTRNPVMTAEKAVGFGWRGVGFYPRAKYRTPAGFVLCGMNHLDLRTTTPLYWIKDKDYVYYTDKDEYLEAVRAYRGRRL